MKTESKELRLQAYLDNEVSSADARQIASWIERDPEAKALYEELRAMKAVLNAENEISVTVPESREFYWSKIQREIERTEQAPRHEHSPRPWWLRLLAPVAGAAALAVFVVMSISNNPVRTAFQEEVSQTDSSITFYSPENKMTVVWISSGRQETEVATGDDWDDFE